MAEHAAKQAETHDTHHLVHLIQEADLALVDMEQARERLEAAKLSFEGAKEELEARRLAFDQVIAKADEIGVARSKLKKLAEERSAALMASGLLSSPANRERVPKPMKAPRKATGKSGGKANGKTQEPPQNPTDDISEMEFASITPTGESLEAPIFN